MKAGYQIPAGPLFLDLGAGPAYIGGSGGGGTVLMSTASIGFRFGGGESSQRPLHARRTNGPGETLGASLHSTNAPAVRAVGAFLLYPTRRNDTIRPLIKMHAPSS